MTLAELLPRLENVTPRGSRYRATCPAHRPDRSPSLQITAGDKGILLKCWAGCAVAEICATLRIDQRDLFYDACDPDPHKRREAARKREHDQQVRERHADQQGALIDALREADYFVQSRRGIDISTWSHDQLNAELNAVADAYCLLEKEDLYE